MADDTGAGAGTSSAAGSSPAPSTAAPGSSPSPSSASASATATPDPKTLPTAAHDPSSSGEPPKERWSEILAHTRTKTEADVKARMEQDYRQKYGWADQFHQDPLAFMRTWNGQMLAHPEYGPQWRAEVARTLRSMRQAAPDTSEEPAPDVPVMDSQGNVISHTYSAPQLKKWQEWSWQQREAAFTERLQPLEQMKHQFEVAQQQAEMQAQSAEHARTTLDTLRQNPYFKEHEPKVYKALAEHQEFGDNVYQAFVHVLATDILPTLSQTEQRKVVDSLQQKAAASTVNPQGSTATQRPTFLKKDGSPDFAAAWRYYDAHPEEAEAMANR